MFTISFELFEACCSPAGRQPEDDSHGKQGTIFLGLTQYSIAIEYFLSTNVVRGSLDSANYTMYVLERHGDILARPYLDRSCDKFNLLTFFCCQLILDYLVDEITQSALIRLSH
uniref:Uncharacterized protein n=1 Tax=Tetranychus urticae TaxID=32264 RepID=T1L4K7_TETUR